MSLLHKTNSVLSILKANDNNDLAYNYPDSNNYEEIYNNPNNLISPIPNLNINFSNTNKIHENININNNNINLFNKNNTSIQTNIDKNIYNNNNAIITHDFSFQNKTKNNTNNNKEFYIMNNDNKNFNYNNVNQDLDIYNNERYSKIIEENNSLKEKLINLNSKNKTNKYETEGQIVIIREEKSKLQLEILTGYTSHIEF